MLLLRRLGFARGQGLDQGVDLLWAVNLKRFPGVGRRQG